MEQKQILLLLILAIVVFYFMSNQESFRNSCDKDLCNLKMRSFVLDNQWSFKDSAKLFKECQNCKSKWYRHSENKISEDGSKWSKYKSQEEAYAALRM